MIKLIRHFVKKYPFSSVCIALIWILSLTPFFPETPLDNVEFIDKWVHILMYGCTFLVVWLEYYFKHQSYDWEKLFFWGWLGPILMSGLLELLQVLHLLQIQHLQQCLNQLFLQKPEM